MTLSQIGSVSSEGGPLLVADAVSLHAWSGADGPDYRKACEPFDRDESLDGVELPLDGNKAIVWELSGAGTADVFRVEGRGFMVARYWLNAPSNLNDRLAIANLPILRPMRVGRISLTTGLACVIWAAISGEEIAFPSDTRTPRVARNPDGTSLVFDLHAGHYECVHDVVSSELGHARRCHFQRLERG